MAEKTTTAPEETTDALSSVKTEVAPDSPSSPTASVATTPAPVKKGANTLIIVIVVIVVILALCCGLSALALRFLGTSFGNKIMENGIQNGVENIIKDEAKKQGVEIDGDITGNDTTIKKLPTTMPSYMKSIIPASWGNPTTVYTITKDNTVTVAVTYKLGGKSISTESTNIENALDSNGWEVNKVESDESVFFSGKRPGETTASLLFGLSMKDGQLEASFTGSYPKQ